MKKFRSLALTLLSVAMLLGTQGMAGASSGTAITREQFIYDFDRANNIQPVYPAIPDFSDVPASSPYYGFIEAAYQKGFINGVAPGRFGPFDLLTRAQIAKIEVTALGDGTLALQNQTAPTGFTDDLQIPSWARGYIYEAVKLGLVSGYPNGTFKPGQTLTTLDEGFFLNQYAAIAKVAGGSAVSVTASATDISVGQLVALTTTVKDSSGNPVSNPEVTYSVNSSNAILSGTNFIASQPGTYTVTATYGTGLGGATGTVVIDVYGTAAGIKIVAPSTIVANGVAQQTATVDVVDTAGNIVGSNSDVISLSSNNTGTISAISTSPIQAVNGVATFTLTSGTVPGSTATLQATDASISGSAGTASATITSTTQVATSIRVTGPQYLAANLAGTTVTLKAQVLDQSGVPMVIGSYPLTASISGFGTFAGGVTTPLPLGYFGNGQSGSGAAYAPITVQDIQGDIGSVTITVTSASLTSGSETVQTVAAGSAQSLSLTPPTTPSFSEDQGTTGLTYGLTAVDVHGYPVADSAPVVVTVLNSQGQLAANIKVDGFTQQASPYDGYLDPNALSLGQFVLADTLGGADAGTYTVLVKDPGLNLASSQTLSFQETAGSAKAVHATATNAYVSALSPTSPITASITDLWGNTVAQSGVPVTFQSAVGNAYTVALSAATVYTNAQGQATVTATALPYVNSPPYIYTVDVSANLNGTTYSAAPEPTLSVQNTVANSVQVQATDLAPGGDSPGTYVGSSYYATSSDTVQLILSAKDSYGTPITSDDAFKLTLQGTGSLSAVVATVGSNFQNPSTGVYTFDLVNGQATIHATADLAGPVQITATDLSTGSSASFTQNLYVQTGNITTFGFYNASGQNVGPATAGVTVTANSPVEVWLKPSDAQGNAGISTLSATLVPSDGSQGGEFRYQNQNGTDISGSNPYTYPAAAAEEPFWYVNGTAGTYYLSANYNQVVQSFTLGSVMTTAPTPAVTTSLTAGDAYSVALTGAKDQFGQLLSGTYQVTLATPSGTDALAQSPNATPAKVGTGAPGGSLTGSRTLSSTGTGTISLAFSGGAATLYFIPVNASTNASFAVDLGSITNTTGALTVAGNLPSQLSTLALESGSTSGQVGSTSFLYDLTAVDSYGNPANGAFTSSDTITIGGLLASPNGTEPTVDGLSASSGNVPFTSSTNPLVTASNFTFTNGAAGSTLSVVLYNTATQTLTAKLDSQTLVTASAAPTVTAGQDLYIAFEAPTAAELTASGNAKAFPAVTYTNGAWNAANTNPPQWAAGPLPAADVNPVTGLTSATEYTVGLALVDEYGNPTTLVGATNDGTLQVDINLTNGGSPASTSTISDGINPAGTTITIFLASGTLGAGQGWFLYTPTGALVATPDTLVVSVHGSPTTNVSGPVTLSASN